MAKSATQKRRREAEADQERRTHDELVVASRGESASGAGETRETGETGETAPPTKKARVEERRSVFVRSLPATATSEQLTAFFSEHFPVKHATVVTDPKTKQSRGYGFVTFTDAEDAQAAKAQLDNQLLDGRRLRLDIAEPRHRPGTVGSDKTKTVTVSRGGAAGAAALESKKKREEQLAEARKAPKLIVRNLPWSVKTSADLEALFRMHGKVKFADVPQSKGKLAGFGFVTLRGRKNAEAAMAAINGKVVDGRTLAVDWAVDKQTWTQQKPKDDKDDKDEDEDEEDGGAQVKGADSKKKDKEEEEEEDEDMRNFMKNVLHTLEEEDSDDGKEDGEDDDDNDNDNDNNDDDDDDEKDWEDEDEEEKEAKEPKKESTDNSSTVFIRNLPFTTTDADLKRHFDQFGAVRYARIVMDRATDRPAGTGFVCFFDVETAQSCVRLAPRLHAKATATANATATAAAAAAAVLGNKRSVLQDERVDKDGRYTLEGRVLQVAAAVSKTEATQLATTGPGAQRERERDKRRLFLLSEGTIARGSPLYAQLPPNEIQMREASAKQRQTQVKSNPSLHLSLTRLAVRNIPRHIDSKGLKELARRAVVGFATDVKNGVRQPLVREELMRGGQQDREAEQRRRAKGVGVVRQAKVIYETEQGSKMTGGGGSGGKDAGGKGGKEKDGKEGQGGRSRGYGFIEYWSHRWALTGLRWLNGHAIKSQDGSKTHRLIVEFAIENANVVARRKANEVRSQNPRPKTEEGQSRGPGRDEGRDKGASQGGKRDRRDRKDRKDRKDRRGGKEDKKGREGRDGKSGKETATPADDAVKPSKKDAKLAMRQQIIQRKRMMRKKKAVTRGGK